MHGRTRLIKLITFPFAISLFLASLHIYSGQRSPRKYSFVFFFDTPWCMITMFFKFGQQNLLLGISSLQQSIHRTSITVKLILGMEDSRLDFRRSLV